MKSFTNEAMAAIEAGEAQVGGAVEIACVPPVRVWTGEGTIPIAGQPYLGIGARGMAQVTGSAIGSAAESVVLTLSGIDPAALDLLAGEDLKGAPVTLWRLVFDSTGTIFLDAHVFKRGRVDTVSTQDVPGGEASIDVAVETGARGLGRRGGRMRTDADQRLIDKDDGGYRRVSFAGLKTLYWGGKKPSTASSALAGGGGTYNYINAPREQIL